VSAITYTLRKIDLIEFNEHHAKMNTAYGKSLTRHQIIWPAVLVIISLFVISSTRDVLVGLLLITGAVLWSTVVATKIKKKFYKHIMGSISDDDVATIIGEYTLRLTPDGLLETKPVGELQIVWEDILKIEKSKSHLYIYLTEDAAIIVPKETVVNPNDLKSFHKELMDGHKKVTVVGQ